jgi:hypothetical protein
MLTFIGQEAIGEISTAQLRSGEERLVSYSYPVMQFVPRLQSTKDAHGVLGTRLANVNLLKSAFERLCAIGKITGIHDVSNVNEPN